MPTRKVTFHGRPFHLPNDSCAAPPVHGVFYVGAHPAHTVNPATGEEILPAFREFDFTPAFCRSVNRQCEQKTGKPCDEGEGCTHEALQWTEAANLALDPKQKQDPKPFDVTEMADAPAPSSVPTAKPPHTAR